jgi:AcrR family transcriptional regulator
MTAPQRRRNSNRRPRGERRRLIVEQARNLFAQQGYSATTLAQIAAASEVSVGVLSRLFPNRQALFEALLVELRAVTLETWETVIAELPDAMAQLHAVAEAWATCLRQHATSFRALHRALLEDHEETRPLLRAFYLECETFVARLINEGQQSGFFRRALAPRIGAGELIRSALACTLLQPLDLPVGEAPDFLPQAIECALHCLLKTDV